MNRWSTLLLALWWPLAAAQNTATTLPITSVGRGQQWEIGQEELTVRVSKTGPVSLQLYGAHFDPEDYRSPSYFGDERYDGGSVSSTFTLSDARGQVLKTQTFGHGKQAWATFFQDTLVKGDYRLTVTTTGNGKNTFRVKADSLDASILIKGASLNIRGQQWIPVMKLMPPSSGVFSLRMYDGDGIEEMDAQIQTPSGRVIPLQVSGDKTWTDTPLPQEQGLYTVYARQTPGAKQFSNTVRFELVLPAPVEPLPVQSTPVLPVPQPEVQPQPFVTAPSVPDVKQLGTLGIESVLVLPDETQPFSTRVMVGDSTVDVLQGQFSQVFPAQTYSIKPAAVVGTTVTSPASVTVQNGASSTVRIEYRPEAKLRLVADREVMSEGEIVEFTVTGSTLFDSYLPAGLKLQLPEGFEALDPSELENPIKAGENATLVVQARAVKAGLHTVQATLNPWNQTADVNVTVIRPAQLTLEKTVDAQEVVPGGTLNYAITVKNTGDAPARGIVLKDELPAGLKGINLKETFDLMGGESKTFNYQTEVQTGAPEWINNTATLSWSNLEQPLVSSTRVRVARLVLSREPLITPTLPGEAQQVTLKVTNPSTLPLTFQLQDQPTEVLQVEGTPVFSGLLQPGETRTLQYAATTAYGIQQTAELLATLTSNGEVQTARTPVERLLFGLEKTVTPERTVVDRSFTYQVRVQNPLKREVDVRLSGKTDQGIELKDAENVLLTLQPLEERTLEFQATALRAGTFENVVQLTNNGVAISNPALARVEVLPLLVALRESVVHVPFQQQSLAQTLVVAQTLVPDASYIAGSSTLNGESIPDPLVGPGNTMYWSFPALPVGSIAYRVQHTARLGELPAPALLGTYPNGRREVLSGTFDEKDFQAAQVLKNTLGNAGVIKQPLDGTVVRQRENITVVLEGNADEDLVLTVNGNPVPAALLGKRVLDKGNNSQRLEYYSVPLKVGVNTLQVGAETIQVIRPGIAQNIRLTPLQTYADGTNPIRFKVEVIDSAGVATGEGHITLEATTAEVTTRDADPQTAGYQVYLTDGAAVLEFRPQATPQDIDLKLSYGSIQHQGTFRPQVTSRRFGVGQASIGYSFTSSLLTALGRGYFEGPLWDGKLYVAVSSDGLRPEDNTAQLQSFPIRGDNSTSEQQLSGMNPVAFVYDHPDFQVSYRQGKVPIDFVALPGNNTALSFNTKEQNRFSAYVALVPVNSFTTETFELQNRGSRFFPFQNQDLVTDSEEVALIRTDLKTGVKERKVLPRGQYLMEYNQGYLLLSDLALPYDLNGFDAVYELEVRYRRNNALTERKLQGGVQYTVKQGVFKASVGAVNVADRYTLGATASYTPEQWNISAGAFTDLEGYKLDASVAYQQDTLRASLKAGVEGGNYRGLGASQPGFYASAGISKSLGDSWTLSAAADYTRRQSETLTLQAAGTYKAGPFSVTAGARQILGSQHSTFLEAGAGYEAGKLSLNLKHAQNMQNASQSVSSFRARYQLQENLSAVFSDDYTWSGNNKAAVGLETRIDTTNLSVYYDLPGSSGEGNRARLTADTRLPLDEHWSIDLKGGLDRSFETGNNTLMLGTNLRYQGQGFLATLGNDLGLNTKGELSTTVKAGFSASLNTLWTVSGDYQQKFGENAGKMAGVGFAVRAEQVNAVGQIKYADGSMGGNTPAFTARVAGSYFLPSWQLRGGLDARYPLNDPTAFTFQTLVGATYHLTEEFGLGANLRLLGSPALNSYSWGYGLEASYRLLEGMWITGGYNFKGFDQLNSIEARPGFYVRLDLLLDETTFEGE